MKVTFQGCSLVPEANAAHSVIQMEIPASGYLWVVGQWIILSFV